MPKLWDRTITAHRDGVREAVVDAAWALVTERGLRALTMSQIAGEAGIGRATLYKYFPDVEAILLAWHQRHVGAHLGALEQLARGSDPAVERLEAVLTAYADIARRRGRHGPELVALLHHHHDIDQAQRQLRSLLETLLNEAATTGEVRSDITAAQLARFCIHALSAAAELPDDLPVSGHEGRQDQHGACGPRGDGQRETKQLIALTMSALHQAGGPDGTIR